LLGPDSELKHLEQKRTSGNFGDVSGEVLPSTTAKACIALLLIQSEDYILNGFRFFGCLSQSNHPLHITVRSINSAASWNVSGNKNNVSLASLIQTRFLFSISFSRCCWNPAEVS
jgi:hypothetical protein